MDGRGALTGWIDEESQSLEGMLMEEVGCSSLRGLFWVV
jgi:hypothetical protein